MNLKDWIEKNRQWQIELGKRLGDKSGGIVNKKKQTLPLDTSEQIIKKCDMPDVVRSFGCEFQFCSAVINKNNNVRCDKCNKYAKNIAP